MQVTDNRRQITVGIFIFIGLIIFVVGVFTLGSQKKAFAKSFTVNVVFDDIEGLKNGANVWFSGVKIGTVKKIKFYGTSQVKVSMNIEEQAHQYIHKDAAASLGADGLIGNKIVVITGGTPKFPFIEDGDRLRVNTTLSTAEMMKTFQENNKNLIEITTDFKTISRNLVEGKGTAGMLLSDDRIARNLSSAILELRNTAQAADKMVVELNRFSRTLNTKGGMTDKMLTDTVVFSRLQASVNELQKASRSASLMAENLNTASSKLNQSNSPAGVLLNDEVTAENIKKMMINLQNSSYNLNENLKALQSNILFRGYFRKKAEAAKK